MRPYFIKIVAFICTAIAQLVFQASIIINLHSSIIFPISANKVEFLVHLVEKSKEKNIAMVKLTVGYGSSSPFCSISFHILNSYLFRQFLCEKL